MEGRHRVAERIRISSGTVWEGRVGYSRAVRVGDLVFVSGTTATDDDGQVIGRGDPEVQARFILEKIAQALAAAGASLADVVRTRIYVTDADDWEAVGRAHAAVFGEIRPANTLVEVSRLVGSDYLVEIEADAVVSSGRVRACGSASG
jgi:enamine deaminase RidA (YjgF/YER057c/UK114 family)